MNYSEIKQSDVANGDGIRVSLFVSGCSNKCKGCFNPQTWDFKFGKLFDVDVENYIINLLRRPYIDGLTLLGGDPFEIPNQRVLFPFVRRIRKELPDKTIWAYTGYILESDLLQCDGKVFCECTLEFLQEIDILVDGPFIESLKDISLQFRGSSNQRILKLKEINLKLK
ncbi:MAG: anaerobic ribonucleoside-triphosphate reductase activating protein [Opitutales bacterium]|jgi:anaerobic ribonucleoside-triphosphate reductase activating protein|nr:anaerobic ribonucleoside-triphosphate reductase activating protein [Opitutales bacterium]